MAKRRREPEKDAAPITDTNGNGPSKVVKTNGRLDVKTPGPIIQIVAGSYERVLHGITASITDILSSQPSTEFANSFLFNAHASAIRCVALSPLPDAAAADGGLVYLATGGSDERVNVYSLSAAPLPDDKRLPAMPTLANNKISENPQNRELGSLMQHSSNITSLNFPTRSKLISASEDNTISISRTRDLTAVSTIKAPRPKVQGQPSGDTAPPGATPAGINDFAIHPSMKLMISVGRGEKTMRLWNLVTGKKASVLNFNREILQSVKEGKYSSGEGRKIRWNAAGTEFAVSFERGVAIFGDNAEVRCAVLPQPLTKVHQIAYATVNESSILAVSTEDGRILFYDTNTPTKSADSAVALADPLAQMGGKDLNMGSRIKDFKILAYKQQDRESDNDHIIVSGSSDGTIRLWHLAATDLTTKSPSSDNRPNQVGKLLGIYETGSRITCLDAFVMLPAQDLDGGLSEFEGLTEMEAEEDEASSDSDDD